jgi:hypothetical protein
LELGKAPTSESVRLQDTVHGHFERVELRIVWRENANDTYSRGKWWGASDTYSSNISTLTDWIKEWVGVREVAQGGMSVERRVWKSEELL